MWKHMKKRLFFFCVFLTFGIFASEAAEKIAVVEPVAKGGMPASDIEAIWGILEANVDGGYEVISRSAVKEMMTEIGFTTSSDLVNMNSSQKARLGEIEGVKYILVTTVGKLGTRINMSLMLLNATTGEIDPEKRGSVTADSLDDLADRLKDTLLEIGLGREARKRGLSALLTPFVKVPGVTAAFADNFNAGLESALLENGIRLQNLQRISGILKKNKIGSLEEAEPALYVRVGELLRVDFLLQPTITRFSTTVKKEYIRVTRSEVLRCIGNIEGNIRVISAQTGEVVASVPFREKINFDDVDTEEDTEDWAPEDYANYALDKLLPLIAKKVSPKLK